MKEINYLAHDYQITLLESTKDILFAGCGVGSGKTDVGSVWILKKIAEMQKGQVGIIAANSYSQLKDSTLRNLYKNYHKWGIRIRPYELPAGHQPFTIKIKNKNDWHEVLCRSLDAYEMISGIEACWAWCDEVWQTKKQAIDIVLARVRDKKENNLLQTLFTTTLDAPDTWMYELFVDNYNPDLMEVVYAPTDVNVANLPNGYIERLKSIYSERLFQRMVAAKWVTLSSNQIYYSFNRNIHVSTDVCFDPKLPLLWSHDFNIGEGKPMSSCLAQIKKGQDVNGKIRSELHFFDEIIVDSVDTHQAINEFKNREWFREKENIVVIYGDASGKAKDTRSKTTDYGILKDEGFPNQKIPNQNPPIRERHNSVNSLLCNANKDIRIKIHPRCKTFIKGLETVSLKKGANYLEEETYSQHVTTAAGYLINYEFPAQIKYSGMANLSGF